MKILTVNMNKPFLLALALLVPVASMAFHGLARQGKLAYLSEKDLVLAWQKMARGESKPVYYLNYLPVSARYYSRGHAQITDGGGTGLPWGPFWLAVHKTKGHVGRWECELRFEPKRGLFDLYYCQGISPDP